MQHHQSQEPLRPNQPELSNPPELSGPPELSNPPELPSPPERPKQFLGASYTAWGLDILIYMMLMLGLGYLVIQGATSSGYDWQWYRVWRFVVEVDPQTGPWSGSNWSGPDWSWSNWSGSNWSGSNWSGPAIKAGLLLQGLGLTLQIAAISLIFALKLAILTVFMQRSQSFMARGIAFLYVEAIRNTPLLIQLFLAYFVLAPILDMGRFSTAVLALALFEGAYMAEILRAGFDSVPQGQWEASRSLGMDERGTIWQVIIPQALRRALPPLTGQAVSLVKDSSLVSVIALHDLTMNAQMAIAETFLTFEIWLLTAGLYLLVTLILSGLAHILERHLHFEH